MPVSKNKTEEPVEELEIQEEVEEKQEPTKVDTTPAKVDPMAALAAALNDLNERAEEREASQVRNTLETFPFNALAESKFKVRFVPDRDGQFYGAYTRWVKYKDQPGKLSNYLALRCYVVAVSDSTPSKAKERLEPTIGKIINLELSGGRGASCLSEFITNLMNVKEEFSTDTDLLNLDTGVSVVIEKLSEPAGMWKFDANRKDVIDLTKVEGLEFPKETVAEFCERTTKHAQRKQQEELSGGNIDSISDLAGEDKPF